MFSQSGKLSLLVFAANQMNAFASFLTALYL
jgi:hypothetical protein